MSSLLSACRAAPATALAALVALAIFVICGFSAGRAIFGGTGAGTTPDKHFTSGTLTRAEYRACQTQIARLAAYPLPAQHARAPGYLRHLYEQNAVTTGDPSARDVPQPTGYTQNLAKYGSIYFIAFIDVTAVNLNAQTATVTFAVEAGNGTRIPAALGFPSGTTLTLGVASTTGGSYTVALPQNIQFVGYADVPLTIPLAGTATNYPTDAYRLTISRIGVEADLPGTPALSYDVDVPVPDAATNVFTSAHVRALPGRRLIFPDKHECSTTFSLIFARATKETFVWLIAALPTVFILLVIQGFVDARTASRGKTVAAGTKFRGLDTKLGVETGVAFLGILTLRAVLVPTQISGVTRVDYLLGAELALLIFFFALGRVWRSEAPESPGGA